MIARTFIAILTMIWASPYTLVGLFLGFIGFCPVPAAFPAPCPPLASAITA